MGSSTKKRKQHLQEIEYHKARRRRSIIVVGGALTGMVVVIYGKQLLVTNGIIAADNLAALVILLLTAFVLTALAGSATRDFSKSGRRIAEIGKSIGIAHDDITPLKRH